MGFRDSRNRCFLFSFSTKEKGNLTDASAYPCKARTVLRGCKALNREAMHVQNSPMLIMHHKDTAEACYLDTDNACRRVLVC